MRKFINTIIATCFVVVGIATTNAIADDASNPAPKSAASLDDELLKGLSNDLLDGLDDLPKIKPQPKTGESPNDDGPAKPADSKKPIIDGEDIGAPAEDADPIGRIIQRMRAAEERIARDQSGQPTQELQRQIVADLNALIEQLKKQQQQQQQSSSSSSAGKSSQRSKVNQPGSAAANSSKPSNQPARDSSEQLRPDAAEKVDADAIREKMKAAWGNLPERVREQMLQSSVDEFLPKYELLIEKYFKRLVEDETKM